mmetsp:Transcript_20795/g.47204  ORF Transcript_20795/g.47204 Transcript_20795/m.47204 type:complete len:84 (+) Transcript_20795:508-759(+)
MYNVNAVVIQPVHISAPSIVGSDIHDTISWIEGGSTPDIGEKQYAVETKATAKICHAVMREPSVGYLVIACSVLQNPIPKTTG